MSRPKLVGITGGIGSGKTTVCKIFETLGVHVYYADDRAKKRMVTDPELVRAIKSIFGEEAYESGELNRKVIAAKAFEDKTTLDKLNKAVHPAVRRDFEEWVQQHDGEKLVLKEAALLIEAGSYKELDALIVVVADERKRIERVLKRDAHRTEKDVKKIMAEQLPDHKKISMADFVIDNNETTSLIKQVMDIYTAL